MFHYNSRDIARYVLANWANGNRHNKLDVASYVPTKVIGNRCYGFGGGKPCPYEIEFLACSMMSLSNPNKSAICKADFCVSVLSSTTMG